MAAKQPVAIVFDTFGTVVDWRGSLIAELTEFGRERGITADWTALVDAWRGPITPRCSACARARCPGPSWTRCIVCRSTAWWRNSASRGSARPTCAISTSAGTGCTVGRISAPGLTRLKRRFIIGPLSNGNVALLTNMAKFAGLPWDMVFGSDLFGHFKPDPETYLGVAKLLDLEPGQVMMAAAHNGDLGNARKTGLMTAFFPRPNEYGPHQKRDYAAEQEWDVVATDIEDLAAKLGC